MPVQLLSAPLLSSPHNGSVPVNVNSVIGNQVRSIDLVVESLVLNRRHRDNDLEIG